MEGFGIEKVLLILVVVLLVFGPKRIPEIGKGLGRGIRDFKSALSGDMTESEKETAAKNKDASKDA